MPSEPRLVLAFDTSAARCAAGLYLDGDELAARDEAMPRGQAERLMPMLEEILAEAGRTWRDLDAIAVCTGPGNFTGARIAVAAARGLAMALGIPAIGISLFEAMAATRSGPVIVGVPDRRRGAAYQAWRDGVALSPPAFDPADLPAMPSGTFCLGSGAVEMARTLGLTAGSGASGIATPAMLARATARRREPAPPAAPLYLHAADARPSSDPVPAILDDP